MVAVHIGSNMKSSRDEVIKAFKRSLEDTIETTVKMLEADGTKVNVMTIVGTIASMTTKVLDARIDRAKKEERDGNR